MYEIHVNYPAIIVVGVVSYLLGTIWYSKFLFGKRWQESVGKSESEFRNNLKPVTYVLTFICWLIAGYVLSLFVHFSGASTFGYGMLAGFLCWFGFVACLSLFQLLFAGRPITLWLINSGYTFFAMILGGGILAIWK
jgi:fatty acid desaturase